MSSKPELPVSGYNLENLYCNELYLKIVETSDELPDEELGVGVGWDWHITKEGMFEVVFSLQLRPSKARLEEARLTLTGVFRIEGEFQTVDLKRFVSLNAPAILVPYLRETMSALTARGFYGPLHLPPVNVQTLMKDMDPETTVGARQLSSLADEIAKGLKGMSSGESAG